MSINHLLRNFTTSSNINWYNICNYKGVDLNLHLVTNGSFCICKETSFSLLELSVLLFDDILKVGRFQYVYIYMYPYDKQRIEGNGEVFRVSNYKISAVLVQFFILVSNKTWLRCLYSTTFVQIIGTESLVCLSDDDTIIGWTSPVLLLH